MYSSLLQMALSFGKPQLFLWGLYTCCPESCPVVAGNPTLWSVGLLACVPGIFAQQLALAAWSSCLGVSQRSLLFLCLPGSESQQHEQVQNTQAPGSAEASRPGSLSVMGGVNLYSLFLTCEG